MLLYILNIVLLGKYMLQLDILCHDFRLPLKQILHWQHTEKCVQNYTPVFQNRPGMQNFLDNLSYLELLMIIMPHYKG